MKIHNLCKKIKEAYKYRRWTMKDKRYLEVPLIKRIQMYAYGFKSDEYVLYDLKNNNRKDYFSRVEYFKTRDVDGDYKIMFDDKLLFEKIFSNYINITKNYAYIMENKIFYTDGKVFTDSDLINLIDSKKKILVKPIKEHAHNNIYIIENKEGRYYINSKETSQNEIYKFISSKNNSIVSEFIEQNGYAHKIFPDSVNTIRVVTIRKINGSGFSIPYAIHRFGVNETAPVDNASKGALFALIDIETGKIGVCKTYRNVTTSKHINTNEQIEGIVIPNWKEIKDACVYAHSQFPQIPFIAWDIAVSENDYKVIEANKASGFGIYQAFDGLRKTELGEFYKHYCGI